MSMYIITLVGFFLSLFMVGVIASFSPVLYATQLTILARGKQVVHQSFVFIAGILSGLFFLSLCIAIIQPETITFFVRLDTVWYLHGWWINGGIGLLCVTIGAYLMASQPREPQPGKPAMSPRKQTAAFYSLGFARSVTRVTGVAALLFGIRLIVQFKAPLLVRTAAFIIMMIGAAAPYVLLVVFKQKAPSFFAKINKEATKLRGYVSRRYSGGALIIMGCAFLILALFVG